MIYNAADYLPNGTIKEDAVPVIEWVSSSKVKVLENLLVAGKGYVLIEKDAPIYHKKAKPITFTVKDDGNTQTIIMQDEYIKPCSLTITKYDGDSNQTIGGVNTKTIIPCIIGLTSMGLGILFLLKKREVK